MKRQAGDGIDQSELNSGRPSWRPLSIAPTVTRAEIRTPLSRPQDARFGSIATESGLWSDVRFTSGSDRIADAPDRQLRANNRPIWCAEGQIELVSPPCGQYLRADRPLRAYRSDGPRWLNKE